MPESLADVIPVSAGSATARVGGRDLPVYPLVMTDVARLQRYVRGLPNPRPVQKVKAELDALRDGLDDRDYKALLHEATVEHLQWPPDVIFDPRASQIFMSDAGAQAELVSCALRVPTAEAVALLGEMSLAQYGKVMRVAFEEPEPEAKPNPKGGAAGTTATPASPPTTGP